MGDVKLTPRQTAAILTRLDDGLRNMSEARAQVIQAMADRRTEKPPKGSRVPARATRKLK
jgi:hypothetical protein